MNISLKKGRSLSESEIKAFEQQAGIELPQDYHKFVHQHDGAEPETNIFPIRHGNESGVNQFIPLNKTLAEKKYIDNVSCTFLPVAWAEGGNYVCLDLDAGGEVFFWDHEEPSSLLKLASSFAHFLEILAPFDANQIELKPGQVKKAWIDPDFLKGIE